jgi:deazaflavin-dependent oxidoreductase (nitroreductase family)
MDPHIARALSHGGLIDMTTTGRRTNEPRRIEIVYHVIGGRIYISGMPSPRKRGWLANLETNPRMTVHLKGVIAADLPAQARVVDGEVERRRILEQVARNWNRTDVETMVRQSPLIEVHVEERAAA